VRSSQPRFRDTHGRPTNVSSSLFASVGTLITFLNKAGVTLSCRCSKKIHAPDTWESLEFNLDVGSITLCLVPQLFMLELMAAWCLPATTWIWQVRPHRIHHALHIFIFYFSCLLHVGGGQGTLPMLVKNVMSVNTTLLIN
jgi:hypothetical protein